MQSWGEIELDNVLPNLAELKGVALRLHNNYSNFVKM